LNTVTLTLDALQLSAVQKALDTAVINAQLTSAAIQSQVTQQVEAQKQKDANLPR
jgi:hypothetical protein